MAAGKLAVRLPLLILALGIAVAPQAAHSGLLDPRSDDAGLLAVDDALRPLPAVWRKGRLTLGLEAAPGCYLYRDRITVEAADPPGYALGTAKIPAGEAHHDEHFGEVRILRGASTIQFDPASGKPPRRLRIRYQGCAENLVCYPPQTRLLDVEVIP